MNPIDELYFESQLRLKYLIKQLTSYNLKLDFLFHFDGENYSYQSLFFWCLLNGRIELAKFFWKYVDVGIATIIIFLFLNFIYSY